MLDPYMRCLIDPPLNSIGKQLAQWGVRANAITALGFLMGLLAMVMIGMRHYEYATIFLILNRFLDGVDGAIARHSHLSDFGGFFDIVCDFIIYSGLVFSFAIANPQNSFSAAFLIFSFIGPITSFLAYATLAAKQQIHCERRGKKSFYYLGGICEGTETAAVLIVMCLVPEIFPELCFVYGILCWLTTVGRIYQAWHDFGEKSVISENSAYREQGEMIKPQGQSIRSGCEVQERFLGKSSVLE